METSLVMEMETKSMENIFLLNNKNGRLLLLQTSVFIKSSLKR